MKNSFSIGLLAWIIGFSFSCKKDKLTEFDLSYTSAVNVPATTYSISVAADYPTPDISTASADQFSAKKTSEDHISEIKMTRLNISNLTGNLDELKSIYIYINATGLAEVLVASKTAIPAGSTSISADLSDVNIKDYIFKDKIHFRVSLTNNTGSYPDLTLKMDETLHVKAKLIK